MLADGRRVLGDGELLVDELERGGQLLRAEALLGDPVEAVAELGILRDGLGELTGAIGTSSSMPKAIHCSAVLARKMSRSSRRISVLLRAWSAYFEPGQRSNMSIRSTAAQKFFQKACSDAIKRTKRSSLVA